jgi:hypothetical protein
MDRPKRKKIYYIPGIISLIIIPITFLLFANREIKQKTLTVLPIVFTDTNFPKRFPEAFKKFNGNFPPKRNYIDISFNGDNQKNKIKLDFAQVRIREILSQNDSTNGLHFKFGESSQYWTFIKVVDILRFEDAKTYMAIDNDIWFYQFPPDTTTVNWICGTYSDIVYLEPKVSWWTHAKMWTTNIWKSSWQIILEFIVFLFSIFVFRRKRNDK